MQEQNILDKIEVKIEENTVWLNQKQLCELFNVSKSSISEHISNILSEKELEETSTVRKFRTLANNGKFYNIEYPKEDN